MDTIKPQPPILPGMGSEMHADLPASRIGHTSRFEFHGTGSEYFRIWIVNILLTILTVTLYSPWAKVRRLKYFYGNTHFESRKFEFTGNPWKIFIGRIILLSLYALYLYFDIIETNVIYTGLIILALFVAMPWLLRSSFKFTARNSKYENTRFVFTGSLFKFYVIMIGGFILILISMGLLYPLVLYWYRQYQLDHLKIGQFKFEMLSSPVEFFKAILIPTVLIILMVLVLFGLGIFIAMQGGLSTQDETVVQSAYVLGGSVIYFFSITALTPLLQGYIFRATWTKVNIGHNVVSTDSNPFKFAWIGWSNHMLRIISLGLLHPWCVVRMHKYKVESLFIQLVNDPSELINHKQSDPDGIGDEVNDFFDIDVAL